MLEKRIKEIEVVIKELEDYQDSYKPITRIDLYYKKETAVMIEKNKELLCLYKGEAYTRPSGGYIDLDLPDIKPKLIPCSSLEKTTRNSAAEEWPTLTVKICKSVID